MLHEGLGLEMVAGQFLDHWWKWSSDIFNWFHGKGTWMQDARNIEFELWMRGSMAS